MARVPLSVETSPAAGKAGTFNNLAKSLCEPVFVGTVVDSANEERTMSWTDERVATLSKLWADGLSASQIAAELGGVTRNAVIGKVHRLGLSGRAKPASSSAKRAKRTRTYATKPRTSSRSTPALRTVDGSTARSVVEDLAEPESLKLSLVELTEHTCKWPHGDPTEGEFHFCGCKVKEDSPYCEYHSKLAFQPVTDRRREKKRA